MSKKANKNYIQFLARDSMKLGLKVAMFERISYVPFLAMRVLVVLIKNNLNMSRAAVGAEGAGVIQLCYRICKLKFQISAL